jgi:RHS repeat-associated protein
VWNKRNQLVAITGGVTASFGYDALGRRQARTVAGTATTFQWDGFNRAKTITGGTTSRMITGLALDEHFGRIESGTTMPFLTDALGSTIVLLNGATVAAEYAYEPYGAKTKVGGTSATDLLFTGREDDGTGQYYYRARYYSPTWGRFISEDPVAGGTEGLGFSVEHQSLITPRERIALELTTGALGRTGHHYSYAFNSPTTYVDRQGLFPEMADPLCKWKRDQEERLCSIRYFQQPCETWREQAIGFRKYLRCLRRADLNYRACISKWPPPFPEPWPE